MCFLVLDVANRCVLCNEGHLVPGVVFLLVIQAVFIIKRGDNSD